MSMLPYATDFSAAWEGTMQTRREFWISLLMTYIIDRLVMTYI